MDSQLLTTPVPNHKVTGKRPENTEMGQGTCQNSKAGYKLHHILLVPTAIYVAGFLSDHCRMGGVTVSIIR